MQVTISIKLADDRFESCFEAPAATKEYLIADEAYKLALLFAENKYIAKHGFTPLPHELAELLQQTDYDYECSGS